MALPDPTGEIPPEELEEEEEPQAPEAETPPPEGETDYVEISGARIPRDELATYHAFHQWVISDPARWQQLRDWNEGRVQLVPAGPDGQQPGAAPEPYGGGLGEEPDEDDLRYEILASRQVAERTALAVAQQAAEVGKERIGKRYGLKENEVDGLMTFALDNRFIEFASARNPNPFKAVEEALDMAYKLQNYDRQGDRQRQRVASEQGRKQNWRSVGMGTSTKTSRKAPEPADEREAFDRMVEELSTEIK